MCNFISMSRLYYLFIFHFLMYGCSNNSSNQVGIHGLDSLHENVITVHKDVGTISKYYEMGYYDDADDSTGVIIMTDTIVSGLNIRTGVYYHDTLPDNCPRAYINIRDRGDNILLDTIYNAQIFSDSVLCIGKYNWRLFRFSIKNIKDGDISMEALFISMNDVIQSQDSLLSCNVYIDTKGRLTDKGVLKKIYMPLKEYNEEEEGY